MKLFSPSALFVKIVKGIAKGTYGEPLKKVYWAIEGYKTWVGLVFMIGTFALEKFANAGVCTWCLEWSVVMYSVSLFLIAVGLIDGGIRADKLEKE